MKKLLTLDQIKAIELDALIALTDYCDNHNLKYYLAYGTLLGAVRHGGFIPWDDDIDIVMLREDYMKLNYLLSKEKIREDLDWISIQNGKWNEPIGKLINTNTFLVAQKSQTSVWVDVFPLDYYDEKIFKKNLFMRRVHISKNTNHFTFDVKGLSKFILKCCFFWKGLLSIALGIEKRSVSVKSSDKIAHMVWAGDDRDIYDPSLFEEQSVVNFEGHSFKTVGNVDAYLKQCYGDYMKLPPEKDRKSHGIIAWWIGKNQIPY